MSNNPRPPDLSKPSSSSTETSASNGGKAIRTILLVTATEDIGLVIWLAILRSSISTTTITLAIAGITLFVFNVTEHSVMQKAENPKSTGTVFLKLVGFTVLEVVNWGVWLALLSFNFYLATIYFAVGFYIEHQITENVMRGLPYLHFKNTNRKVTLGVILETISEGAGARLWIFFGLTGIIFLVIGSTVEHTIQYFAGRLPNQ